MRLTDLRETQENPVPVDTYEPAFDNTHTETFYNDHVMNGPSVSDFERTIDARSGRLEDADNISVRIAHYLIHFRCNPYFNAFFKSRKLLVK